MAAGEAGRRVLVDAESHLLDRQIARLGPLRSEIAGLNHHQRVRCPVEDHLLCRGEMLRPHRLGTDNRRVIGRSGGPRGIRGASENRRHLFDEQCVVRPVPRFIEPVARVQLVEAEFRQDQDSPTVQPLSIGIDNVGGRKRSVLVVVLMQRQTNGFEMRFALTAVRCLALLLNRRDQEDG